MTRVLRSNLWAIGLAVLLLVLLGLTKLIQPSFGFNGLESLARASLPFAFATAAMAVVVIVGGIDLSVGSMMAVCSVTAAVLMTTMGWVPAVAVTLLVGVAMGAINGSLIVLTRVPDIVVTLAMLFVWEGVALLILSAPGGSAAPALRAIITGPVSVPFLPEAITAFIPKSLVVLVVCLAVVWVPLSRSKLGLWIYAVGSDPLAAFRSGVPIGLTRIVAYALCGLFAALGGLSLTLSTGIGEPIPGPYLMASVAAVVLGGVVLGGGVGGLLGPIIAVFILRILRMDLTLLSVDPNVSAIIEGTIMAVVVMFGGLVALRGRRA